MEKAVALIEDGAGNAFDPNVVAAFREALPKILAIKAFYQDDTINPKDVIMAPDTDDDEEVWIPWRDSYSVGNDIVDEHHRYLIGWMNRAHKAVSESAGAVEIAKALFALAKYTRIHFKVEERLLAAQGLSLIHI